MGCVIRLGRDHPELGELEVDVLPDAGAATAISAGVHKHVHKNDPNEDALFARVDGDVVRFGVADAHWGGGASAILIERLAAEASEVQLARVFEDDLADARGSETTLIHVTYDRRTRLGGGQSFGDSTVVVVGEGVPAHRVNEKSRNYVTPNTPEGLEPERARVIAFEAPETGLIVAFSDGVDECHYGQPETSIGLSHLDALFEKTGPDPRAFVEQLARMAMAGVDGNPGGQDNIAIVAVRA